MRAQKGMSHQAATLRAMANLTLFLVRAAAVPSSSTVRVYQVQRATLSIVATVEADAAVTSLRFQADGTLIVGQATCQAVAYKPVQSAFPASLSGRNSSTLTLTSTVVSPLFVQRLVP